MDGELDMEVLPKLSFIAELAGEPIVADEA